MCVAAEFWQENVAYLQSWKKYVLITLGKKWEKDM